MRQAIERSNFYTMRRANNSLMRAILTEGINPNSYLGHGTFSVVFATGEETVAKLTVDPVVVQFCEEARLSYDDNPLFPKVSDVRSLDQEVVGFDGVKLPLFRIDCERLIPIKRQKGSIPWVRSLRIRRALDAARQALKGVDENRVKTVSLLTDRIAQVAELDRDFSMQLVDLVGNLMCGGAGLDAHGGNLMQRANGEVVINDILCTNNDKVWNAVRKYTGGF